MLVVAAALFGVFFFCTLYLQQVLGFSALKTGIAYLPLTLTLVGASALASRLVDRFTPKPVLVVGLLISTAGFVLLTRIVGHVTKPAMCCLPWSPSGWDWACRSCRSRSRPPTAWRPATRDWPLACSTPPSKSVARWDWRSSLLGFDDPRDQRAARRPVPVVGIDAWLQGGPSSSPPPSAPLALRWRSRCCRAARGSPATGTSRRSPCLLPAAPARPTAGTSRAWSASAGVCGAPPRARRTALARPETGRIPGESCRARAAGSGRR
jgi:hypothetical protein